MYLEQLSLGRKGWSYVNELYGTLIPSHSQLNMSGVASIDPASHQSQVQRVLLDVVVQ